MHIYDIDGVNLPSVTTIIHILGSDKLLKWANYQGFKHTDISKVLDSTSRFGNLVHSAMEHVVNPDTDSELMQARDQLEALDVDKTLKRFHQTMKGHTYETIYAEHSLGSVELGYAGTLDWLCKFDDKVTLFDFKTSKMVKQTHKLQLGGYKTLLEEKEGIKVEQCGIILLSPNNASICIIKDDIIKTAQEAFPYLVNFYKLWGDKIE